MKQKLIQKSSDFIGMLKSILNCIEFIDWKIDFVVFKSRHISDAITNPKIDQLNPDLDKWMNYILMVQRQVA